MNAARGPVACVPRGAVQRRILGCGRHPRPRRESEFRAGAVHAVLRSGLIAPSPHPLSRRSALRPAGAAPAPNLAPLAVAAPPPPSSLAAPGRPRGSASSPGPVTWTSPSLRRGHWQVFHGWFHKVRRALFKAIVVVNQYLPVNSFVLDSSSRARAGPRARSPAGPAL